MPSRRAVPADIISSAAVLLTDGDIDELQLAFRIHDFDEDGLLSKTEFESGYGFYYVDLSHLENEAEDNMSKAIQVLFTNGAGGSTPLNVDFYIYLYFQKELHLNISNGAFLSI